MRKLFVITVFVAGLIGATAIPFTAMGDAADQSNDAASELFCESSLTVQVGAQPNPSEAAPQASEVEAEALVCDDFFCDQRCIARGCLVGVCDTHGACRCFLC